MSVWQVIAHERYEVKIKESEKLATAGIGLLPVLSSEVWQLFNFQRSQSSIRIDTATPTAT